MTNNRERLAYALKAKRLHEVLVLKDDIHLQYKYKNINRASRQAATLQDKIIDIVIEEAVTGTADPIKQPTVSKAVENIIDTNLRNDTKRFSYGIPDKAVEAAVSNISNRYQWILGNRIREEIPTLQDKIEQYKTDNKADIQNLSEAELRDKLKEQYGEHAQKRIQNIIKDSFHTNECNLSWIKAVNDGYNYKSWMNGRTKRTRSWHKAKFIESVPIDETFDIYGSYPARMMYPGDLNGGAENVANCKCWLRYSNKAPSDLRGSGKKSTTRKGNSSKYNKSSKSKKNDIGLTGRIKNTIKKPVNTIKSNIENTKTKITINSKPNKNNKFSKRFSNQSNNIKDYIKSKLLKIKYQLTQRNIEDVQIHKGVIIKKQKNCDYTTIDDVKKFYDVIPDKLKKNVKEIEISNKVIIEENILYLGCVPVDNPHKVFLLNSNENFEIYKGVILHEFAHVFEDTLLLEEFAISNSIRWKEAYINDILHILNKGYDLKYEGCVSEYAMDAYFKYFEEWNIEGILSEDFADSVKLYFTGDKEFINRYPNRCEILKELFGVSPIVI